jgi:hypothetical protein
MGFEHTRRLDIRGPCRRHARKISGNATANTVIDAARREPTVAQMRSDPGRRIQSIIKLGVGWIEGKVLRTNLHTVC